MFPEYINQTYFIIQLLKIIIIDLPLMYIFKIIFVSFQLSLKNNGD